MKKVIYTSVVLLLTIFLVGTPTFAQTEGVLSFNTFVNVENKDDFSTSLNQLSLSNKSFHSNIYAMYQDSSRIYVEEARVNFELAGLDFQMGKVIVPFGFENLNRAECSVFITYARKNFSDYGLKTEYNYGILSTAGTYFGYGDFCLKLGIDLYKKLDTFSLSYTNYDSLQIKRGDWVFDNKLSYKSIFFGISSLLEWYSDTGDFWSRIVITPGVFDVIGIFGAYYNVDDMDGKLPNMYSSVNYTFGGFLDISPTSSISIELNANTPAKPLFLSFTTKF